MAANVEWTKLLGKRKAWTRKEILDVAKLFLDEGRDLPEEFFYSLHQRYGGRDDLAIEVEDMRDAHFERLGLEPEKASSKPFI